MHADRPAIEDFDAWTSRLSPERASWALSALLRRGAFTPATDATAQAPAAVDALGATVESSGLSADVPQLGSVDTAVVIHDLELMRARIRQLQDVFPAGALHTAAIKANPIVPLMRQLVALGCGLEAASWEECELALASGCRPDAIIFDSPAKTRAELARALALGVHINADNTAELDRIDDCLQTDAERGTGAGGTLHLGLRVNPSVGGGSIATTSVGGTGSRFGVSLAEEREVILAAFERYPWLNCVHVHVGSQGVSLEQLVLAAQRTLELVEEIERRSGVGRVTRIDLGGGLPVAYREEDTPPSIRDYAAALRREVPALLDSTRWTLLTEFGRALHAGCAAVLSRIEYVKEVAGQPTAVVHVGADMFLRRVYQPQHWYHAPFVMDARGHLTRVRSDTRKWLLAGPLCFGGDVLDREAVLSGARPDGWIGLRDVGAYTLALWSRHCSRAMPLVVGIDGSHEVDSSEASAPTVPQAAQAGPQPPYYQRAHGAPTLRVLKQREQARDIVRYWGGDQA